MTLAHDIRFKARVRTLAGSFEQRLARAAAPILFLREWLSEPARVGAIWPSSRWLARRIAAEVPVHGRGLVVELGAGTGVVTEALLARGVRPERLIVVERSAVFVDHLRERFPGVVVLLGDATNLARLLPPGSVVATIVSGLPLLSLPDQSAATIVSQWRGILAPHGLVVQFTYDLRGRVAPLLREFTLHASGIVWANLPPARVMALAS